MKAEVISTCLVLLILFPIVSSSSSSSQEHDGHTSNKHTLHHQLPRKLSLQIRVHGFLLWASMGFLMPLGILIIRMSNREECGRRVKIIFRIHATLQVLSVILATIGAIMSVINFENSFKNSHQRMGLTLYGVIWLQALIGFMRPHRGSSGRSVWFLGHWILGTTVSVLGIINVYTGLHAYHKRTSSSTTTTSGTSSSSIRLWTLLFTAEVCLLAFFYLFQDKWPYIQKQGVILGNQPVHVQPTDQMIYPRNHKPNDSC